MSKVDLNQAETAIQGLTLLERDESGDLMHVWSFPGVDERTKSILLQRSQLSDELIRKRTNYTFSRASGVWHYSLASYSVTVPKNNKRVESFSFVLSSKTFNPEKYLSLLQIMNAVYGEKGNVVEIFSLYLASYTGGTCFVPRPPGQPCGEWKGSLFNNKKALISNCSIRDILLQFQAESVILWQAMVLKKNILIYSDSITKMQKVVRAMPHFVFQRGEGVWRTLHPLMMGTELEVEELAGLFVAGTCVSTFRTDHPKLFDLYIDLDESSLTVSEHAKKDFGMGKMHKQIAGMLNEQSKAKSDTAAIKSITTINLNLIKKLKSINGGSGLTNESLTQFSEEQKYSKSEARFVMNFSLSEGLL